MPIHPDQDPRFVALPAAGPGGRSVGDLTRAAAARGGHRPFVTFYDDASGERTELGHATLDNWVSKAANLLADEFDLGPGASVLVGLGTHWTTLVVLLAAWRCGAQVRWHGGPVEVTVLGEERAGEARDPARTLVVGAGLAGRLTGDAGGGLAFTEEVLACPDEFDDPDLPPGTPALLAPGGPPRRSGNSAREERTPPSGDSVTLTHGDLVGLAAATIEVLGLAGGERLLLLHPLDSLEGVAVVLAALDSGAAIVLVANPEEPAAGRRAVAERCDLVLAPGPVRSGEVATASLEAARGAGGALAGVRLRSA